MMMLSPARLRFFGWMVAYGLLIGASLWSLLAHQDLSLGRNPLGNLHKTFQEFAHPSFLDAWFGNQRLEYKSDDGTVLRIENRREVEQIFLHSLLDATWVTIKIGTLGSLLAAIIALPLGLLTARNLRAPRPLQWVAKLLLDGARSIHTLVFGLIFVGIIGLGATAGILAIAAHSMGTYGKLYAETIESVDMAAANAVRSVGASAPQVFFTAIWPTVLPQLVSNHLYVWEFNIRDSTILGMIGAGGLGLLISEAVSLFQWGRLATILLAVITLVAAFDALSRRIRQALL